jgi:two-component system, NarL family, nitrate/nitrite response regulator NarL
MSGDKPLRVLIVSTQTLWRAGLRCLLDNADAGIDVIGEASPGPDTTRKIKTLKPDILILNIALPKGDRLQLLRRIRRFDKVRKIIVTGQIQPQVLAKALRLDIKGVVFKGSPLEELIQCIHWVAADGTCIQHNENRSANPRTEFKVPRDARSRQGQRFRLTHREMDVVEAVVAGYTNKQIAGRLRLSVETVRHHVTNIFNKTGASNRLELVLFAIEKKLVDSSQLGISDPAVEPSLQREQSA